MKYAIQIIKADGSKAVTQEEGIVMAYLLASSPVTIKRLDLNSDNIEAIIAGAEGTWLDLMNPADEQAFIDYIKEAYPSEAEALKRAHQGH